MAVACFRFLGGPEEILKVAVILGVVEVQANLGHKLVNLLSRHAEAVEGLCSHGVPKMLKGGFEVETDQAKSFVL